jgi:hypothetical protein
MYHLQNAKKDTFSVLSSTWVCFSIPFGVNAILAHRNRQTNTFPDNGYERVGRNTLVFKTHLWICIGLFSYFRIQTRTVRVYRVLDGHSLVLVFTMVCGQF